MLPETPRRDAPKPPSRLDTDARRAWRALWRSQSAWLWDPQLDGALVELVITLRRRALDEDASASTYSQLQRAEDRLLLSPRARLQAGIRPTRELEPEPAANGKGRKLSAKERARLVRG